MGSVLADSNYGFDSAACQHIESGLIEGLLYQHALKKDGQTKDPSHDYQSYLLHHLGRAGSLARDYSANPAIALLELIPDDLRMPHPIVQNLILGEAYIQILHSRLNLEEPSSGRLYFALGEGYVFDLDGLERLASTEEPDHLDAGVSGLCCESEVLGNENHRYLAIAEARAYAAIYALAGKIEAFHHAKQLRQDYMGRIFVYNASLVHDIIKSFRDKGLDYDDLFQEGTYGLMRAAEGFRAEKQNTFRTYTERSIRQTVHRALMEQARIIRIPEYMQRMISRVRRFENDYISSNGIRPTRAELRAEFEDVFPKRTMDAVLANYSDPISLDDPGYFQDDDDDLHEFVGSETLAPAEIHIQNELGELIDDLLMQLSPRESQVLTMVYGLDGNPPMTLSQIGKKLGVTGERVRQIRAGALGRLKHPRYGRLYNSYLA